MADERHAELVALKLDTPGGLDTSMRQIIKQIIASPVPVAVFVAPDGARTHARQWKGCNQKDRKD